MNTPSTHRPPMSSTAAVNGSNANGPLNSTTSNSSGGRAQLKMTTSAKAAADGARKQAASPVDGGQKKPPQPRAWQGTNPITQRPSSANPNGVTNAPRPSPPAVPLSGETASPMKHLSDRMYYLLANLSGLPGDITLKTGEKYTGVLSGTSLDPTEMRYVFKMVKKVRAAGDAQPNGTLPEPSDDYIGTGDNHVMAFDMSDVADFHVGNVILDKTQSKNQNGVSSFRTDTDISGNMAIRERTLQKWEPSSDGSANLSLESSGQSAGWDQFATNERLFGVRSDYDENIYTTTIDRSHPQYAERVAHAEKKAREIENSSALNAHVMEERAQNTTADREGDEEDLYSGVYRPLAAGGPNKYTPPARRPPSGQPTVKGAPVDPAIISSQLARPESATAKAAQRTTSPPLEKRATPEPAKEEASSKANAQASAKPQVPKEDLTNTESEPTPAAQPAATQTPKPSSAFKPVAGIPARKPGRPENATANVEHDLLDSFKAFSAAEKLRMSERQRSIARESKAVKLNDLKKFSQNFKLNTPVPSDLVPILAKDEGKQQLIVEKALRAVKELKASPPKATPAVADVKPATRPTNAKPETAQPPAPSTSADRQQNQRARPGQNQYGSTMRGGHNQNMNQGPPRNPGLLSSRLQLNQQQHKQGTMPYNGIPQPIPGPNMGNMPPTGPSISPSTSGVQTPMSNVSRSFNIKAPEFKPNPAAITFQPSGTPSNHSSPRPESVSRQEPPRKIQISIFFSGQRPTKKPLNLDESFNPITRMTKEASQDAQKARQYQNNGGMQPSYHTPPTWDFPEANMEKGYIDMFERPATAPISAPHNVMGNGPIPHQHQLPLQFQGPQGVPQGQTPHHTPRHPPVQPHHGQGHQFDAQHMQFSQSNSSVHPSPRPMPPYMYGSQPQPMPAYPQQVPMQQFGMSPGVQHVGLRGQGGPQFVSPPGPGMGAQMMTSQPSNGPYIGMPGNPQMQMYSGAPGHGYPQYPQMPAGPGANGFPSPRPGGAPLMAHQGSQQGHQPQHLMYMQPGTQGPPIFAQMPPGSMTPMRGPYAQPHQPHYGSPHQHHQFPQQHRGTPSASYSQPMMPQHSMPPQVPPTGPTNHVPESGEEVK